MSGVSPKDFSLGFEPRSAVYTLLARFTRHVLSSLRSRLRSSRPYVYGRYECPSRPFCDNSRRPPPLTPGSTGLARVKNGVPQPFRPSPDPPAVSLNPRYPCSDLLGNLSSDADDIRDPTQLGSLMTSRVASHGIRWRPPR